MKKSLSFLFAVIIAFTTTSCFKDQDDEIQLSSTIDIQNFVWKGLNYFYLYKADQPDLADNRFSSEADYKSFLKNYASPENLFNDLIVSQDRFSFIVSDYRVLENALNGTTTNNGMEFGLRQTQNGDVFGYVRYVLANTSAAANGVERGMKFNRIDGIEITADNYTQLLSPNTYTIGLATFDGENISPLEESITLTKQEYTENPVYIAKTFNIDNQKIGYLMYNGFTNTYDDVLNAAFADFNAEGVTDLVVDLRYNGGGSIETSNDLASMITGQFNGELFTTQVYNENFDDEKRYFNNEVKSGAAINSLNLTKVYILTTQSTASASELLISSLMPYIDVVQIGETTTGKFQGSVTLYDSPNYTRNNINLGHRYAMQPLILKSVNANGFTDYTNGITPDIVQPEDFNNLGTLGDLTEPLLETAINNITGSGRQTAPSFAKQLQFIGESKMNNPNYQRMYLEDLKK